MLDSCTHWTRLLHVDLMNPGAGVDAASTASAQATVAADRPGSIRRVANALMQALAWARSAQAKRRRARRMLEELRALDELELHDLGLDRAEIESVVAELVGNATPTRLQAVNAVAKPTPLLRRRTHFATRRAVASSTASAGRCA